jgi:hypothetical protein
MVYFHNPKPQFEYILEGHGIKKCWYILWPFRGIRNILWPFSNCLVAWYVISAFWYQEKSGNPGSQASNGRLSLLGDGRRREGLTYL